MVGRIERERENLYMLLHTVTDICIEKSIELVIVVKTGLTQDCKKRIIAVRDRQDRKREALS